jgi:hypothetical protein
LLGALAIFTACLQGARAPNIAPRGELGLGKGDETVDLHAKEDLAPVFASPRGQTVDPSEITIVFNQPMRALELAGDEAAPPVTIKPAVKGRWAWVGTMALQFVPADHLPRATTFEVEVPATTKSLSGKILGAPFKFSFSTARPTLARSEPYNGARDLEPSQHFTLRFDQPIADAEVLRAVSLTAAEKKLAFDVKRPDPKNEMLVELAPRSPLPLASSIEITTDKTLRGKEGPLPSDKEETLRFETYGPLVVKGIDCSHDTPGGKCSPDGGFNIELSTPVKVKDLKKAFTLTPSTKLRFSSWRDDEDFTTNFDVYGQMKPRSRFHVKIAAGLKDKHGQSLAQDWSGDVGFDDFWPSVIIGQRGEIFEPGVRRDVPVATLNVQSWDLVSAALTEDEVLALHADGRRSGRTPTFRELLNMPGRQSRTVKPQVGPNTVAVETVKSEAVLGGKDKRGPLAIGASWIYRPGTRNARTTENVVIAQVTDLALTAKVSPHGSLVFVTRLSTGEPVDGAKVAVRKQGDGGGTWFSTDKNGFATIPESAFVPARNYEEPHVIVAHAGDDWTYRAVREMVDSYRYGVSTTFAEDGPIGMLFTERGIYRPGETVKLKGIVRQEAKVGTTTPAGESVDLAVDAPDGEAIYKGTATLGVFGTFSVDVKIPETSRLGTYDARATVRGVTSSEMFEVAEYRPSEFKVGVESDRPSYVRGDKAGWAIHGDYLFGAPMTNASARVHVIRTQTSWMPPGLEGVTVDDETYWSDRSDAPSRSYELLSHESKLDGRGVVAESTQLAMSGQRGTELVTCDAEVTDVSRQAISSSSSAVVHPADFYVALKPPKDLFVKPTDKLEPQVLAVDPKGAKLSGVAVQVELLHRTWQIARQTVNGGVRTSSNVVDTPIASCVVTTSDRAQSCALVPGTAGYFILRAHAKDKRGNEVFASLPAYATGEGGQGWSDTEGTALKLVADRTSYEIGQTAHVLVKSPWKEAEALVTVERAGVYTQKRMKLTGAMPTIDVPITDDLRPNAFLSVMLLKGRTKAAPTKLGASDVGAPAFRVGYTELSVNPEARRLSVAVKANKSDYKPGETIDVDVDVKDRKGAPAKAEVTLYAVDEGVLMLVGYRTPDPIKRFGAPRALKVATIESREALASAFRPFQGLGLDKGADGGDGGGGGARKDFRASAYYNPSLLTDGQGHGHVQFKLPDGLSTYRIMAVVAAEDDRFGYAESKVTTSRPLMARPALPRFLRAGDELEASVVVSSKGLDKQKVDVGISVEGLVLKDGAAKSVELEQGGTAEVRFALSAPRAGKAKVRFTAKAGAHEDSVEVTRDVKVPALMEAVALYGDTTTAQAEKLGDLSAIRDDVGGLEVSMASSALVGLGGGVEQLVEYPYGCTEQLTSRLVPLLPLRELARDFKLTLPADIDRVVNKTVAEVLTHQKPSGGFGLWADSAHESGWVTAYALWGLNEAKRHDVSVPQGPYDSAVRFLRGELDNMLHDDWTRASAPFILDVLAEAGQADPGRITKLAEEKDKLPLFARAELLHAAVLSKSDAKLIASLVTDLEAHVRIDAGVAKAVGNDGDRYAVLMDSDARTSAMVLRGLLAAKPDHPLAARLAMGLLAVRKGGAWRSTQETAWALLSIDDYRRAQEKQPAKFDAHAFLGDNEIMHATFEGHSTLQPHASMPAAGVIAATGAPLAFTMDGTGRLFYEARLRYARKVMPKDPLERGFFVKKTLRKVDPAKLEEALATTGDRLATDFSGGDLVLGEVIVVVPSPREFVVIDDPLPAGLEAVDARLATTGRGLDVDRDSSVNDGDDNDQGDTAADDTAMGRKPRSSEFVREVRDDRVLFFADHLDAGMYRYRYLARATSIGAFALPPTKAEEMYTPEVFGRSGATTITVHGARIQPVAAAK